MTYLNDMAFITLTQDQVAEVDDADYAEVSHYKWHAYRGKYCWYARTYINIGTLAGESKARWRGLRMHQLILPGYTKIDHIDGNGLNNSRSNLRPATSSQNSMNSRKQTNCSSQYKGVSWFKRTSKWTAVIQVSGKLNYLGSFHQEIEAAHAYDQAARLHFGPYARLNFPT